jgi:TonB family protein
MFAEMMANRKSSSKPRAWLVHSALCLAAFGHAAVAEGQVSTQATTTASANVPSSSSSNNADGTILISSDTALEAARFHQEPEYPPTAREFRLSGEVVVEFTIGLDGKVENLAITKGSPIFNAAVLSAVKKWSFIPFVVDGRHTKAKSTMTFVFKR